MSSPVIVWVHGDCLSPSHPGLKAYPDAPALFVFDDALLRQSQISLKRVTFLYECLLELPVTIRRGSPVEQLADFAAQHGARQIVTTASPSPRFEQIAAALRSSFTLTILEVDPFLVYDRPIDLARFSRYWSVAQQVVLR